MDLIDTPAQLVSLNEIFMKKGLQVLNISALTGDGIEELKELLLQSFEDEID